MNDLSSQKHINFFDNASQSDFDKANLILNSSLKIENWLTTEEAARYLKISEGTLRNLTSLGKVIFYKFGRRNRYLLDDLQKLVLSNKRGIHEF